MLEAKGIKKTYKVKYREKKLGFKKTEYKEAVKEVNIKVDHGQIVGLLGVNGAGKTTTIKMLTTMIEPTEGSIMIDGLDVVKEPMKGKEKLNLITGGERNIYWRLTAKENLQYFGRLYGIPEKELSGRIDEILKIVNLDDVKNVAVEKYSKGMKQRLQIARGLINNPDYIFLDEPTLGLDILIARELRNYVKKLATEEKKGILLTTHYITEAEELCDYIYVINDGEIVTEGKAEDLKRQYTVKKRTNIEMVAVSEQLLEKMKQLNNDTTDITYNEEKNQFEIVSQDEIIVDAIAIINECNCQMTKVVSMEPSLEDALFNVLGGANEKLV